MKKSGLLVVFSLLFAGLTIGLPADISNKQVDANSGDNFTAQNVSGNEIVNRLIPKIIISEIMPDPNVVTDADGEWFELYNAEDFTVNIDGWKIRDLGIDNHIINNGGTLNISAHGFLVLGSNKDYSTNGGAIVDYQYSSFTLSNADEIILTLADDTEIDRVIYSTVWPFRAGASMYFGGDASQDNSITSKWAVSTIVYGSGDKGSPGAAGEGNLPVELSSFTASFRGNQVNLKWTTKTEVTNYGFEIERASASTSLNRVWEKIGFVSGAGNSNSPKYYSFSDNKVPGFGKYSYRLKQIDTDGKFEYSPVVEVDLGAVNEYVLNQNYPNPFNPSTVIKYAIPKAVNVKLSVYNILGSEVATLVNEFQEAGVYTKEFSVNNSGLKLSDGVYFYKLEAGNFTDTKKFILMK